MKKAILVLGFMTLAQTAHADYFFCKLTAIGDNGKKTSQTVEAEYGQRSAEVAVNNVQCAGQIEDGLIGVAISEPDTELTMETAEGTYLKIESRKGNTCECGMQ